MLLKVENVLYSVLLLMDLFKFLMNMLFILFLRSDGLR